MFFNVKGILWTLGAIVAVMALCAIDLSCSGSVADAPVQTTIGRIRGEISAGRREISRNRADSLNVQIRDLRVMARRMVREGRHAEARRVFAAISELEKQSEAVRAKSESPPAP